MILRLKDIWMWRTPLESVFNTKRDIHEAELLRPNGEVLLDGILYFRKWQNDKWTEFTGERGIKSETNPDGLTNPELAVLTKRLNELSDEEGQKDWSTHHSPVPISKLSGGMTLVELVVAQKLGLIARTEDGG